jgi:hypothetical protein
LLLLHENKIDQPAGSLAQSNVHRCSILAQHDLVWLDADEKKNWAGGPIARIPEVQGKTGTDQPQPETRIVFSWL